MSYLGHGVGLGGLQGSLPSTGLELSFTEVTTHRGAAEAICVDDLTEHIGTVLQPAKDGIVKDSEGFLLQKLLMVA